MDLSNDLDNYFVISYMSHFIDKIKHTISHHREEIIKDEPILYHILHILTNEYNKFKSLTKIIYICKSMQQKFTNNLLEKRKNK